MLVSWKIGRTIRIAFIKSDFQNNWHIDCFYVCIMSWDYQVNHKYVIKWRTAIKILIQFFVCKWNTVFVVMKIWLSLVLALKCCYNQNFLYSTVKQPWANSQMHSSMIFLNDFFFVTDCLHFILLECAPFLFKWSFVLCTFAVSFKLRIIKYVKYHK